MKKKKVEEKYKITPKGIIYLCVNDEKNTDLILDSLELAARREECNALLFTPDGGEFVYMEKNK